jgi:RNA polymerase-binding transcription factor DksA
MTDEVDRAEKDAEFLMDAQVRDIHSKVTKIPAGVPGECDKCGEDSPRLVEGNCARCRDKFKLF